MRAVVAWVLVARCCVAQEVLFTQSPAFAPQTMAELVKSSHLIARGKFKGGTVARAYSGLPDTDHLFVIDEVLKGEAKIGSEVLVAQAGGEWEGKKFVTRELVDLEDGAEALMFLVADGGEGRRRRFRVNGVWVGAFVFRGKEVEVSKEVRGELREVARLGREGALRRVRAASMVGSKGRLD